MAVVVEGHSDVPYQRVFGSRVLPAILEWKGEADFAAVEKWIAENKAYIEKTLLDSGAILFRNFPLHTAALFDSFVKQFDAFGYQDLPYDYSLSFAVRLPVVGRVCTTNEGKTGGMAQAPYFPTKLFFYCERAADVGGATGICPSDIVLDRLQERYPEFVAKCAALGLQYTALLTSSTDASVGVGRSWKSFFGRDTVAAVEARMAELKYTWAWLNNGETLKITTPVLPAIREVPGSGRKVFFNQAIAQLGNAKEFMARAGATDLSVGEFLKFGDGSAVEVEPLEYAKSVCDETAVELQWQAGDVGLLDNFAVMHARRAFDGNRKVYASLVL